ncbi:hypothetical protein QTI24_08235 [Variovorax sp. J22P240]|uniref:hypothetical protein n=1 Tax=unclassified Variovorax TaxID=663243 RepID=UPI002575EE7D|nr:MULTISPECIES: hypothetical protein [unclassified Variovorax]MDL9998583.1 hypothetical protein [Variovorax sp. J22P240]MDM0050904.1 hypothetical protein [Variovorax sp. J22R115]
MISADPPLRPGEAADEPEIDEAEDTLPEDDEAFEEDDAEATDELSEETGIDLTDASELDADNVPADEEFDRVIQAPD